jgi:hypothetical protein
MADQMEVKRKNYQWPCSCLTAEEMAILYRIRAETGKPINLLIKEAIRKLDSQNAQAEAVVNGNEQFYSARRATVCLASTAFSCAWRPPNKSIKDRKV